MLQPADKEIDWIFPYFGYLRPFKLVVKSSPSSMINKRYEPKLTLSFLDSKMENLIKTCSANTFRNLGWMLAPSPNKKVVRPKDLLDGYCV